MEKISIIIPSFNSEKTIEKCIKSILNQTYQNTEIIIIDGCSTDQTLNIIKKYKKINIISEPDKGVYDAFNKGIKISTGQWLYFMGSDDFLFDKDVLKNIFKNKNYSSYKLIIGKIIYDNSRVNKSYYNWTLFFRNSVHHQACFYKKTLFENFLYDLNFKVCADYELNLVSYLKNYKALKIDAIISDVYTGGISGKVKLVNYIDLLKILKKHNKYYLFWSPLIFTIFLMKKVINNKVNLNI